MSTFLTGKLKEKCQLFRIFMACAEYGNVTRAAIALDVAQSFVSRKLAEIESMFNMKLLIRQARGVTLTESGKILYNHLYRAMSEFSAAEDLLDKATSYNPKVKPIRIGTTATLAEFIIPTLLADYAESLNLTFEVNVFSSLPSLLMDNLDVIIWAFNDEEIKSLQKGVVKKLTTFSFGLYASQAYLNKYGTPLRLKDLENHKLVILNGNYPKVCFNPNWHIDQLRMHNIPFKTAVSINNSLLSLRLGENGLGIIGYSPEMIDSQKTSLIRILQDIYKPEINTYMMISKENINNRMINELFIILSKILNKFQS